ncbi:unnamed protein product [Bubo scandiacus]
MLVLHSKPKGTLQLPTSGCWDMKKSVILLLTVPFWFVGCGAWEPQNCQGLQVPLLEAAGGFVFAAEQRWAASSQGVTSAETEQIRPVSLHVVKAAAGPALREAALGELRVPGEEPSEQVWGGGSGNPLTGDTGSSDSGKREG